MQIKIQSAQKEENACLLDYFVEIPVDVREIGK